MFDVDTIETITNGEVVGDKTILALFTLSEYRIFSDICRATLGGEFINTNELSRLSYGHSDKAENDLIRTYIAFIRRKLSQKENCRIAIHTTEIWATKWLILLKI